MEIENLNDNHTGSVVAQVNQDRASAVTRPAGVKSKRDVPNDTDRTTNNLIEISEQLKIMSLNVEGLSMAKCEYLSELLRRYSIDVLALQETHIHEKLFHSRFKIPGYTVVSRINHETYGTMIYARDPSRLVVISDDLCDNNIHRSTIKYEDITIVNIYKPPNTQWPLPTLPKYQQPAIILGDFNSHHHNYGYRENDERGEAVMRWANKNNLKLLYSSQDKGTFHSARWQRDYTPDLVFVTVSNAGVSHASRRVLSNFPRSQHRPFLVTLGITVPYVQTLPKPRWNFNRVDWKLFSSYIDKTCKRIPANIDNIKRFCKLILTSAKKHIPRGFRRNYVPCWSEQCTRLLEEHERTQSPEIAEQLLEALSDERQQ